MTRPKLLDAYCCEGGAAVGYARAGFDVYGVDNDPKVAKRYPFAIHIGDALRVMRRLNVGMTVDFQRPDGTVERLGLADFTAVHASPPCQLYTVANNIHGNDHPDLLPPTRELLIETGLPYVIENVPGAPMENYITLCGLSFGLGVKRHRQFETSWFVFGAPECPPGHPGEWVSVFGHTVLERGHVVGKAKGGGNTIKRRHLGVERGRDAMGMPWASRHGLSEAIPPAYTEWIGSQLLAVVKETTR